MDAVCIVKTMGVKDASAKNFQNNGATLSETIQPNYIYPDHKIKIVDQKHVRYCKW
ncbi:hypothetical protein JFT70_07075 [Bacillus sp. TH11]|nr:hypothetical protein [Bacillus sp. TH11]